MQYLLLWEMQKRCVKLKKHETEWRKHKYSCTCSSSPVQWIVKFILEPMNRKLWNCEIWNCFWRSRWIENCEIVYLTWEIVLELVKFEIVSKGAEVNCASTWIFRTESDSSIDIFPKSWGRRKKREHYEMKDSRA